MNYKVARYSFQQTFSRVTYRSQSACIDMRSISLEKLGGAAGNATIPLLVYCKTLQLRASSKCSQLLVSGFPTSQIPIDCAINRQSSTLE